MKGPKTKPQHLKVLKGTNRKHRSQPDTPTPSSERPECPEDLSPEARRWFSVLSSRLEEEGRLSSSHTEVLAEAADRRAQIEKCREAIASEGWYYESEKRDGGIMMRPHPMVAQLNEAQRHLQSLLAELGLTPASLHKVAGSGGGKKKNAFEALG